MTDPTLAPWVVDGTGPFAAQVARSLRTAGLAPLWEGRYAAEGALWAGSWDGRPRPRLVVLVRTTPVPWSAAAPWQAGGVPHLPVAGTSDEVEVGPLVVPGRSACVGCLRRARERGSPPSPTTNLTPPDGLLGALAGALVAFVAHDAAGGAHLAGVSTTVRLSPPTLDHRFWPAHPRCGCGAARPRSVHPPEEGTMTG